MLLFHLYLQPNESLNNEILVTAVLSTGEVSVALLRSAENLGCYEVNNAKAA